MTTRALDLYRLCTALWSFWGYFFIFLSKSEELRAETFNSFPGPWTRTLIFRILFLLFGTRSPLFLFSWLEPFILHFDELANLIIKLSLYNFILQSTCCITQQTFYLSTHQKNDQVGKTDLKVFVVRALTWKMQWKTFVNQIIIVSIYTTSLSP